MIPSSTQPARRQRDPAFQRPLPRRLNLETPQEFQQGFQHMHPCQHPCRHLRATKNSVDPSSLGTAVSLLRAAVLDLSHARPFPVLFWLHFSCLTSTQGHLPLRPSLFSARARCAPAARSMSSNLSSFQCLDPATHKPVSHYVSKVFQL